MPKYCYVYVLHSLADDQFYVGLTRDLPACGCKRITKDSLPQLKSESHSSLSIEEAVLTRAMRLGERSTSRPRGENDTSKRGYEGISRDKAETGRGSAERREPSAALTKECFARNASTFSISSAPILAEFSINFSLSITSSAASPQAIAKLLRPNVVECTTQRSIRENVF